MSDLKVTAWDCETAGLDWWDPDHRAFLFTWADESGEYCARADNPAEVKKFVEALKRSDVLIAHNLSFDAHHTREATGHDVLKQRNVVLEDTDLMSRVLFPEGQNRGGMGGHGLKNLAKVYLRADAGDEQEKIQEMAKAIGLRTIKQTGAFRDVWLAYPEVMERYALADARYTWDLWSKFSAKVADNLAAKKIYELEREVMPILIRAEQRGVALDQAVVAKLTKRYKTQRTKLRNKLEAELGEAAISGEGSQDAMLEALQKIGVPLYRKTETGQLATHKFALQEFEDAFPILADLREYRTVERFLNTYLSPMAGVDTIHTNFMQIGAWTGRMSSRRPNMQNVPNSAGKEVRSVFVPREGHSFVVVDYDAIEIRLLAYYMADQGFRDMIAEGHDPHAWMAANIHGGAPEDYFKGTPGQPKRDAAKNTLFAITYGAGAPRVSDMNKISRDEAKALIATIKGSLPGYGRLQGRIRSKIQRVGYVNTLFGRKQPVNREKAYVGLNALIQGSAADIMKQGLVNAASAIEGFDAHVLLVVHDELVVECPTPVAERCRLAVEQAMVDAFPLDPPLKVTGAVVSTNYADAK